MYIYVFFFLQISVTDWAVNMQKALPFSFSPKDKERKHRFLVVNHNIICTSEDNAQTQMITRGIEEDLHKLKIIKYFGKMKGLGTQKHSRH